jgi:hypothetical protein
MRWRPFVSALAVVAGVVVMPASASASVPEGFVGMNAGGPFFYPGMNEPGELSRMIASGVESVRVLASWDVMQPYASEKDVPTAMRHEFTKVGGVPTNFASMDRFVALAASRRLTVLPVVEFAPAWDAQAEPRWSRRDSAAEIARTVRALRRGTRQALRNSRIVLEGPPEAPEGPDPHVADLE